MQVQKQKHNISRIHCSLSVLNAAYSVFRVDKTCDLRIMGSRVNHIFFRRTASPEYASVAQLAEQLSCNQQVAGSNPVGSWCREDDLHAVGTGQQVSPLRTWPTSSQITKTLKRYQIRSEITLHTCIHTLAADCGMAASIVSGIR